MSINDQIEEAWKEFRSKNGMRVSCQDFAEIYRAALRGLYVEVKPEELNHGQIYYASWPGQSVREVYCGDEDFSYWEQGGIGPNGEIEHIEKSINPDICKVYELSIPSPAEVFGEGV